VSDPIAGGSLLAVPYDMNRGDLTKNSVLLDHMVKNRMWFAASLSEEEARVNTAWMLANQSYFKYEVWNGGRLAGMILLHDVVSPVNATFHFSLFGAKAAGVSIFGTKKLLWNFLGFAFDHFGLRRISMEIPEHYPTLIRFVRQKLGFRYESEGNDAKFSKLRGRLKDDSPSMQAALALYGSRREGAHWNEDKQQWEDVVLLRLTKAEYEARRSTDKATLETPATEVSSESWRKISSVRPSAGP
jgi:RimJ/RimL family protein N-acetyltransferase